jgi:plasmid stabilization system protein ParE
MYRVIILAVAKSDIKEAASWYNNKQEGLGKRFTAEIRKKVNHIKRNPFTAVIRYDDVRTFVLEIFPFMVHYIINEPEKSIIILGIFHTSRNPDIWKDKREVADE